MNNPLNWSPGVTLEQIEKEVILLAFRHFRGNKTTTSNALGIAIRTLDSKLEKYELDGKTEKERLVNEQSKRNEFLARSRGNVPNNINGGSVAVETKKDAASLPGTNAGIRMESPAHAPAQSPVSMPERGKVQTVLPGQTPKGYTGGRR